MHGKEEEERACVADCWFVVMHCCLLLLLLIRNVMLSAVSRAEQQSSSSSSQPGAALGHLTRGKGSERGRTWSLCESVWLVLESILLHAVPTAQPHLSLSCYTAALP